MNRCVKYRRISRDREGRELGVQRQDEDLNALARASGLDVVGDYFDNDLGASTRSRKPRPDYQRLLNDARAGRFDVILAYSTSRLTRRPRELEDLLDLAVDHGIRFAYVRSPSFDLQTAQGREIARTMAARDAGEAEELAERVARQKQQAAEAGQWRGGRRPYGYGVPVGERKVFDKKAGAWVLRPVYDVYQLVPEEAADIAHATREVLLGGSLRSLAAQMNARGRLTSTGRPWTATELRKVLKRARNAGLIEVNRGGIMEVVGPAAWPAIVTEQEWRAVVAVLNDPDRRTNATNVARRWLGAGLYQCGVCADGTTVRCTRPGSSRPSMRPAYRCKRSNHLVRAAELVDEVVELAVLGWLARPEAAAHLDQRDQVDTGALRAEAERLRGRLDEADEMFAAGELDRRRLAKISAEVRGKLDAVQAQLASAVSASPLEGILGAGDLAAAWARCDIPRRQAIIDTICEVVLHPGRKGRPAGWRGGRYFDAQTVEARWRV